MAKSLWRLVKSVIFWEYDRGTWQYDVLAALILLLIFFAARGASRSWIHQPRLPVTATDPGPSDLSGDGLLDPPTR